MDVLHPVRTTMLLGPDEDVKASIVWVWGSQVRRDVILLMEHVRVIVVE